MIDYRIDSHKIDLHPERVAAWLDGQRVFPIYAEISPAGACSHRCGFCAQADIGYVQRYLDADLLIERLLEMKRLGLKSCMAGGAGEPTLHPRLGEVIVAANAAGLDFALTTNAVAMTERFSYQALSSLRWIKASVNGGTPRVYTAVHKARDRDWDRVWNNLATAIAIRRELGATTTIGVQCVVLPENADTVLELVRLARSLDLDYCTLKPYSAKPTTPTPYDGLSYEPYASLFQEAERESTDTFSVIARRSASQYVTSPERGYDRCLSTGNFWCYLEADWNLYSCSAYINNPRFCLGNLKERTFEDVWMSGKAREHTQWVNEEMDCSTCRRGCRMDPSNRFLWRLTHRDDHDGFI